VAVLVSGSGFDQLTRTEVWFSFRLVDIFVLGFEEVTTTRTPIAIDLLHVESC